MRGLGGFMLNWASEQAAKTGKSRLRLDAWTNNPRLLRYYERQGYTLVRVVDLEHRQSGALFQRSV
ncbi:GNAT family N-acetyltransferase [Streptomyces sp. J2-1]|nr:GNAT family N-acetyltransferase [Streptomyces corallincola]